MEKLLWYYHLNETSLADLLCSALSFFGFCIKQLKTFLDNLRIGRGIIMNDDNGKDVVFVLQVCCVQ